MRQLPTPPAPGKPVSATLIRQLIDAIRERTILPGRNASVKRGPNGTVLNVDRPQERKDVNTEVFPFKVIGTDPDSAEHAFEIYIPNDGSITFVKSNITIDGISSIEDKDYWFTFDFEDDIGSTQDRIYLYVYIKSGESEDEGQPNYAAELTTDKPNVFSAREDVNDIVLSSEVASVKIDDESKGKVLAQVLHEMPLYHVPVYQ